MSGIDSLKNAALEGGAGNAWEKHIVDMNDIDENFANARDLGKTRLNYSRITAIGEMSKMDSVDIYKTTVVSPRGKLAVSLRNDQGEDKVLNLSKYEKYLDDLKRQTDPEGWQKEQELKAAEEAKKGMLDATAPDMKIEVYKTDKFGRPQLIGDSSAEKGTKEYDTMRSILEGEYAASQGDYFIKVSRSEDADKSQKMSYAMQVSMGKSFKHDYVAIEQKSEDSRSGKKSTIPMISGTGAAGSLSSVNALQIQASRYQATAQMLEVGYMNMADVYLKNMIK